MKPLFKFSIPLALLLISAASLADDRATLSLADAISRALQKNPAMAIFDAEKRIAEANVIIAKTRPNPELETEIEDVFGSGDYRSFDSAVYNVGISQLIETGQKRKLRGEISSIELGTQELQYEAVKRELMAETGRRFVVALAAQNAEANARDNFNIADEAYQSIKKQIEGGRGNAIDSGQALLGKNEANLALENAKRDTQLARQQLSVMWASTKPDFKKLNGNLLKPVSKIPSVDSLNDSIGDHPAMTLAEAGVTVAETQLVLEGKNKKPDVTVALGYRRDSTVEDNALVLGFSLPLPLFDKNQGGIARAEAEIEKREALVSQMQTQLELKIAQAHATLTSAKYEHELVSGEMLEAAETHYKTVTEGFDLGRIKYLELLEARRSLNAVRKQKIEALAKYHSARVELETLTGKEFDQTGSDR